MAAEIRPGLAAGGVKWRGFNEAAANGRGNLVRRGHRGASAARFNEAAANGRGNRPQRLDLEGDELAASMRPRRMAAEIGPSPAQYGYARSVASMRPRRMAAEISPCAWSSRSTAGLLQ